VDRRYEKCYRLDQKGISPCNIIVKMLRLQNKEKNTAKENANSFRRKTHQSYVRPCSRSPVIQESMKQYISLYE
jgi:hypothetical protein